MLANPLHPRAGAPARMVLALLLAGCTLPALTGCEQAASKAAPAAPPAERPLELSPADVTYVRREGGQGLSVSGVLAPLRQATIKARSAGELLEVPLQEGDAVRAGQFVARVDSHESRVLVAERRALLASAEAEMLAAERHRDAQKRLLDAGFVAPTAYDVAQAAYLAKQSARAAAQAQLTLAETALAHTEVRAGTAGLVFRRHANAGEYVAVGAPLVTVMDPSSLQLVVSVPATEIARVRVGDDCRLALVGDDAAVVGRVSRVSPAPEGASRSYAVYVDVDNRDGRLRIGMFARGELMARREAQAPALPSGAVRRDGAQDYVLTVEGGRIARRPVVVRSRDEALSRAEVEVDFDTSLPVIVTRHEALREGLPVVLASGAR